jgi:membrane protein YqaA with SNARE-associated domain
MDWASIVAGFLEWSQFVIQNFGYFGVFIVSAVSAASIFLPVPGFLFILAASPFLNPWILGVVAGAGMAIGELTGYALGRGGNRAVKKRELKWLSKGEEWFKKGKGRGFLFIVIFAATPLPDDITGILGGIFRYDWKMFLLAAFIGKTIMNLALAFAGFYGSSWLFNYFQINL